MTNEEARRAANTTGETENTNIQEGEPIMNILPDSSQARTAIRRWAAEYSAALRSQSERAQTDATFAEYAALVGVPLDDVDAQYSWALSTTTPPEWPAAATPGWVGSTQVADGFGGTVVVTLNGAPHRVGDSEAVLSTLVTVVTARDGSAESTSGLVEVGDHTIADEITVGWSGPEPWESSDWREIDALSKALRGAAQQLRDLTGESL